MNDKTDKELRECFIASYNLRIVEHYAATYVLADNGNNRPVVWAVLIDSISEKWIITDCIGGRQYMFKDNGLFGWTDNKEDMVKNSFDSLKSAVECFNKFYNQNQ